MTKNENEIIFEVMKALQAVPDVKNPMNVGGVISTKKDFKIVMGKAYEVLYNLYMSNVDKEDDYIKELLQERRKEMNEFIKDRENENWKNY